MRRASWLLLAAIIAIFVWVGMMYFKRRDVLARDSPNPPKPLEKGTQGRSIHWTYTQNVGGLPKVTVTAEEMRQEGTLMALTGVQLQIFHADAKEYDLVKTGFARFDIDNKTLTSDGNVEITMDVPVDAPPRGKVLRIHTSGVRFASDTGKAYTDRPTTFEFDRGNGSSVGAEYDPTSRDLMLKSQVVLNWAAKGPDSPAMRIESAEAIYHELDAQVHLLQWTKLTRGTLHVDGGATTAYLEKGEIQRISSVGAHGVQDDPGRKVEFAADELGVNFAENTVVQGIQGSRNARLVSTSATARTTVTGDRIDLEFKPSGGDSILSSAAANGGSVAESAPIARESVPTPETRVLKSDVIRLAMRPGGQEIQNLETDGPGTLDFVPNRPDQSKRWLKGDKIWIAYGNENRLQSFRSINVNTRTDRPPAPGKAAQPPMTTESKEILATFDANGQLAKVEQKTDFAYREGERQARGDRAEMDQVKEQMTLDGSARFWDPSASVSADSIVLDQKTGDYTAEGRVATTRQPDKKGSSSAMLSNDEVLQARAQKLVSTGRNQKLHYEGKAVAWQGANRVEADKLDIDRQQRVMEAHGSPASPVVSQFLDRSGNSSDNGKAVAKGKATPSVFTVVRAPELHYKEESRLATYRGGVLLTRPGLTVNSRELQAYLSDSSSDSSLDKAVADGAVKIVSVSADPKDKRTRTGTSEHADYFTKEQKVLLEGGAPLLVDSVKGRTTGRQLTWFANNDRLLVDGEEKKPAESTLRKK
jgi:lipopolysaccharide export system protein LptA